MRLLTCVKGCISIACSYLFVGTRYARCKMYFRDTSIAQSTIVCKSVVELVEVSIMCLSVASLLWVIDVSTAALLTSTKGNRIVPFDSNWILFFSRSYAFVDISGWFRISV